METTVRSHDVLAVMSLFVSLLGTASSQENPASSDKEPEFCREITASPTVLQSQDNTEVLFRDFGRVPKGKICKCTIRIVNPTGEAQEWYVRNSSCYSMHHGLEARFRMAKGVDAFAATL